MKLCVLLTVPQSIIRSFPLYTQQNLYVLLCVQWKTPDDGQRNCPKHVEIYSKNKFDKLVHLVGFIVRIYHDARSPERQVRVQSYFILKTRSPFVCFSFTFFFKPTHRLQRKVFCKTPV